MESSSDSDSSHPSSLQYLASFIYGIEDVRPHGDVVKFQSAAYYNCLKKPS